MLLPGVEMMKARIGLPYNDTFVSDFEEAKFLLFSSHDYQLSHVLRFLEPENVEIQWIDYASVLLIELHQQDRAACEGSKSKKCYFVQVYFNNDQLKLPGCKNLDCDFDEYERYILKRGLTYSEMDKICFSEPPLNNPSAILKHRKFYIS